jgi:hypothetical protein
LAKRGTIFALAGNAAFEIRINLLLDVAVRTLCYRNAFRKQAFGLERLALIVSESNSLIGEPIG